MAWMAVSRAEIAEMKADGQIIDSVDSGFEESGDYIHINYEHDFFEQKLERSYWYVRIIDINTKVGAK